MANPVPVTYNAAASPVAGGRFVSVPMDVSANVWTPTKDSLGRIRLGSWANLPLNEWCVVSGAALSQIASQLDALGVNRAAYDYGTSNGAITATITPWTGVAVDHENSMVYFPRGGGHADSSLNGTWKLNLERMGGGAGFDIEDMPSNPDAPGFEWSADYRVPTTGSFSVYTPYTSSDGNQYDRADILPDGKPVSLHTYGGVWHDPLRNKIGSLRNSRWQYSLTTKTWQRALWASPVNARPTIYGHAHWDSYIGAVRIFASTNDVGGQWWIYDDATQTSTLMPGAGMTGSDASTWATCGDGRYIYVTGSTATGEKYSIFDMQTATWIVQGAPVTGVSLVYDYTFDMSGLVYIPEWGKCIHYLSRLSVDGHRLRTFDPATGEMTAYSPPGANVINGNSRWVGNKLFYYPRRKCVVFIDPISDATDCVYVMRVG